MIDYHGTYCTMNRVNMNGIKHIRKKLLFAPQTRGIHVAIDSSLDHFCLDPDSFLFFS